MVGGIARHGSHSLKDVGKRDLQSLHPQFVFCRRPLLDLGEKPLIPQEALIHGLVVVRLMPCAQPLLYKLAIGFPGRPHLPMKLLQNSRGLDLNQAHFPEIPSCDCSMDTARGPAVAEVGPGLNAGSGPTPEDRHFDHRAGPYSALGANAPSSGSAHCNIGYR